MGIPILAELQIWANGSYLVQLSAWSSKDRTISLRNGPFPGLFFLYFRLFKKTLQLLQQIHVKKCPSSIWYWDSNTQPSDCKFPPITARPGLPPIRAIGSQEQVFSSCFFITAHSWHFMPYLKSLDISWNPLRVLTKESFQGLLRLQDLVVQYLPDLKRFDADSLSHLHYLTNLAIQVLP